MVQAKSIVAQMMRTYDGNVNDPEFKSVRMEMASTAPGGWYLQHPAAAKSGAQTSRLCSTRYTRQYCLRPDWNPKTPPYNATESTRCLICVYLLTYLLTYYLGSTYLLFSRRPR